MRSFLCSVSFALLSVTLFGATAQTYPDKPLKMIVANTPGTSHDLFAREVAPKAAEILGQPIVIDNRGGAGGIIGTEIGGRSTPDGYTIVLGTGQTHAINVGLHKTLPYDPVADFTPVARLAAVPLVMVVTASLPVKTVAELVALAKQKPGQLNFASSGNGTSAHLAATGTDLWLSSPEQLGEFTRSEIERYRKLIEISGAKVD